ncbi:thioredoxin fold domain-containing protein [Hydrogenophaga sp.]|uniref:thioredoxin fold domain-containing protein n=1 Tax=Hydrogenophaga sp. TaxID=1904254 RepID=UPI00272EEBED|nr:thioredoxin fold domain-containing protein [Hydrogenophaga sp.]MDP2076014.1 thioredoxin fold domain-containing protein [Hydrogenophaga sp.]MDP3109190.1 thioredoxin fold domain-containing protein [Hydrogenophaga sp.]
MKYRHFALPLLASLTLLTACSKEETSAPSAPSAPTAAVTTPIEAAQALDVLAAQGKGFAAGKILSANAVYVLFDPQCPHCARLWEASMPLHTSVKFVWLPVAIMNAKSAPQGAAIMTATNPVQAMAAHETSLLAGSGGTAASADIAPDVLAAIKTNTALLERLGATSVPYIVARHQRSNQVVMQAGANDTQSLATFLGL